MSDSESHPAYVMLRENLRGKSMTMEDALAQTSDTDPDPGGKTLDAISEGNVVGDVSIQEQVRTLASLGYSIETTADALGVDTDTVETFAQLECNRLAERSEDTQ